MTPNSGATIDLRDWAQCCCRRTRQPLLVDPCGKPVCLQCYCSCVTKPSLSARRLLCTAHPFICCFCRPWMATSLFVVPYPFITDKALVYLFQARLICHLGGGGPCQSPLIATSKATVQTVSYCTVQSVPNCLSHFGLSGNARLHNKNPRKPLAKPCRGLKASPLSRGKLCSLVIQCLSCKSLS